MSKAAICTLGELERAVELHNADFEGTIRVIYSRNGKHGYNKFIPDGTVSNGIAVAVQMDREGYASRLVGKFRVMEFSNVETAPLETLGKCPAMRWVILYRLLMSDYGREA